MILVASLHTWSRAHMERRGVSGAMVGSLRTCWWVPIGLATLKGFICEGKVYSFRDCSNEQI
jgi:hypothetical protein